MIPVNDNPYLIQPLTDLVMDEDQEAVVIMLSEYFADIDSDSLDYSAYYQNTAVLLEINDDEMSITPRLNWNGNTQVTIQANDGFMTLSDAFNIMVNPVNDLPQIVEVFEDYILEEDFNTFSIDLGIHFTDIDGDVLIYQVNYDDMAISTELVGDVVYISSVDNWNGNTILNVMVYDDLMNEPVTADINLFINPVNDAPTLELDDEFDFAEDTEFEVDFAPYISDVDLDDVILTVRKHLCH